ncbi:MAG: DnaJ domain-containing protein, partial [Myxococcota bacterium]|nr:DnaJ domain-containing protein [Myxococcota bacterium]
APAAAPKPEAAKVVSPEEEVKELTARVAKLKDQNLFQVLGLEQNADSAAVKMAYFKLARIFHPDTVTQEAPPEIGRLKGEIFASVGDAYRRLGEDKSRAEYLEELKHGGGEQIDIQQILMAEEYFQKGCILVKAKKFPDAVKMLDDAIKANDKEGEFYAWRGYAKYFAAVDKGAARTEIWKDFNTALKLNERVGSLHYFMGHIAKLSGDNTGALKHFKKATEYQPDHTDALRELRMMGTGKR